MGNTGTKKRLKTRQIMIGCPEDVEKKYLQTIKNAIEDFNSEKGVEFGIELQARHWRDGTYSGAGNPQKTINKQLCDKCEYLLAVFYCSIGSANASEDTGTFTEVKYFADNKKQVFLHRYASEVSTDISNPGERKKLQEYLTRFEKEVSRYTFKNYVDETTLKEGIISDLTNYFKELAEKENREKKENASRRRKNTAETSKSIQDEMKEYIRLYDRFIEVKTKHLKFSFLEKSKDLIAGMRDDGSVEYYTGKRERYRTTPTASTLEALYLARLLPDHVRFKMQDWVYNSRQDPSDDPDKMGKPVGHPPDDKDAAGWSWNEGVSVWATSKALGTLIMTGYYEREDVYIDEEKMNVTYAALKWLAEQQYGDGGWGFQYEENKPACKPSVTMTALTLKVITKFLKESYKNDNPIKFSNDLEKALSTAKGKGIEYLVEHKQSKDKYVWWEYDGEASLTATVWVLEFINAAQRKEAGELYNMRQQIVNYCISKLPNTEQEYEDYDEEVYFVGGDTKYKPIEEYSKFYSYLPYHIPVIMQSGANISEDGEARINLCIRALTKGKAEYWYGRDNKKGRGQHPTCFVRAMALSVVAFWMRKTWGKLLSEQLGEDWGLEEYNE